MTNFYPVFLDLRDKKCLVVGGGKVAAQKVNSLLSCHAKVTVLSPELSFELQKLTDTGKIKYLQKTYNSIFLEDIFLVIGSTANEEVNSSIAADCRSRHILVNIVDVPSLCSFIVPAVARQGDLSIAISTAGKSPALAARLRKEIESSFDLQYGSFLDFLGALRPRILETISNSNRRKALFLEMASKDFFNFYSALTTQELNAEVDKIIARYQE